MQVNAANCKQICTTRAITVGPKGELGMDIRWREMEGPRDEAGHQGTGINDNNICNILSDHWLAHAEASETNISSIATHNGPLNTYGGALLNTCKRKRLFNSIALRFSRPAHGEAKAPIRSWRQRKDGWITQWTAALPATTYANRKVRQDGKSRRLRGKKKKGWQTRWRTAETQRSCSSRSGGAF